MFFRSDKAFLAVFHLGFLASSPLTNKYLDLDLDLTVQCKVYLYDHSAVSSKNRNLLLLKSSLICPFKQLDLFSVTIYAVQ